MLKTHLKKLFLTCALSASQLAAADFYVGGQAGSVGWDDGNNAVSLDVYGGYQLSEFLALEIAYTDLGNFDFQFDRDTYEYSIVGASYSAVGILPLDDVFSLKGKISYFDYSIKRDLNGKSDAKAEGGDFTYSAGLDINLADNVNLSLEYRYIPLKFDLYDANNPREILKKNKTENADNFSLGLNISF